MEMSNPLKPWVLPCSDCARCGEPPEIEVLSRDFVRTSILICPFCRQEHVILKTHGFRKEFKEWDDLQEKVRGDIMNHMSVLKEMNEM